jgi:peptidoglycan/LPS O-acetylase OafA/YrhL
MDFTNSGCYPSAIAEVVMKYRREIDGLRAFAVIPVILYHADMGLIPGGFVGVDIFFVISGYLITTIILEDLDSGRFSILRFYERRLRRIAPALLFVCLACLPFAALWMLPSEFKAFGKGLFHTLLMVSNFELWGDISYFAAKNELKPLLHTWSLSVEEQFYLFFPAVLWGMRHWRKPRGFYAVAALALSSLLLTWPISSFDPAANFYLPFTRIWEPAVGALLAIYGVQNIRLAAWARSILASAGLAAIIACCLLLRSTAYYPGVATLAPCMGALLVIAFASPDNLAGRLLGMPWIVGIGLISYSLYLWHQPIFAFARLRWTDTPPAWLYLVLIGLTFVLAIFSYRFVETPFRRGDRIGRKTTVTLSGLMASLLIALGVYVAEADGFPGRDPGLFAIREPSIGISSACNGAILATCVTDPSPAMAVWGDSFAMHLVDGIIASVSPDEGSIMQLNMGKCGPFSDIAPALPDLPAEWPMGCINHNAAVRAYLSSSSSMRYVVLASQFHTYLEDSRLMTSRGEIVDSDYEMVRDDLEKTLGWLRSVGLKPVVFAPPPRSGRDFGLCVSRAYLLEMPSDGCAMTRAEQRAHDHAVLRLMTDISQRYPVVSLENYLCNQATCRVIDRDIPIYRDDGHFSKQGSKHLGRALDFYHHLVDAAEHGCVAGAGEPHGICQLMPVAVLGAGAPATSFVMHPAG